MSPSSVARAVMTLAAPAATSTAAAFPASAAGVLLGTSEPAAQAPSPAPSGVSPGSVARAVMTLAAPAATSIAAAFPASAAGVVLGTSEPAAQAPSPAPSGAWEHGLEGCASGDLGMAEAPSGPVGPREGGANQKG